MVNISDPHQNKYFSMIEHIVLDKCKGNPHAFMLYCYYKRICGQNQGQCYQSRKTIEEKTGIARSTQKNCNLFLQDQGLIKLTIRKEGKTCETTLIQLTDIMPENLKKFMVGQEMAEGRPGDGRPRPGDGRKEEPPKKNQKEKESIPSYHPSQNTTGKSNLDSWIERYGSDLDGIYLQQAIGRFREALKTLNVKYPEQYFQKICEKERLDRQVLADAERIRKENEPTPVNEWTRKQEGEREKDLKRKKDTIRDYANRFKDQDGIRIEEKDGFAVGEVYEKKFKISLDLPEPRWLKALNEFFPNSMFGASDAGN